MTKQELHSIRSLRDEIKFWERALERIRNKSPVGSPQFDAVPCNSGIGNRVQDRVENTRSIEEIIAEICARLKEAQIENIDAIELIRRYNDENTLLYCDPPYLQSLRRKNMYSCELSEEYHINLLSVLKESKSKIVLSGYDSQLYNSMLSGWNTDEKQTTAQMGKHRVEKIWFNF